MKTQFLNIETRIRGLTDAELDECREACGPYPIWGEEVEGEMSSLAAGYVTATKDAPAELRMDEASARKKAFLLIAQHRPDDAVEWARWFEWRQAFATAVVEAGLIHPSLDELPPQIDRATYIAKVFAAIDELTHGDEGKEQAQPSPPTSPQDENARDDGRAATSAPTQ